RARAEEARVAGALRDASDDLSRGRDLLARGELAEARMALTRLQDRLGREPRLGDVRARVADALDEVRRGLDARDRLARLPPTRASLIRRASCLARAGDPEGAARRRAEADRLGPSGALDHFLIGLDLHHAGDLPAALRHFDRALQEEPGLFWAQCFTAIDLFN